MKGKRYSPATEFKKGDIPWTKIHGHKEETKNKIAKISKRMWSKKSYRRKMKKIHRSESFRAFQGDRIKKLWQDPEYKESRLKYFNSKEGRRKAAKKARDLWSNPFLREKMISIHNSPESKARKSFSHLKNKEASTYLLDRNWLHEQYCVKSLPVSEIARKLKVCKSTIYKWIKNHNLR